VISETKIKRQGVRDTPRNYSQLLADVWHFVVLRRRQEYQPHRVPQWRMQLERKVWR
jgi:hypothetical protein